MLIGVALFFCSCISTDQNSSDTRFNRRWDVRYERQRTIEDAEEQRTERKETRERDNAVKIALAISTALGLGGAGTGAFLTAHWKNKCKTNGIS